VAPIIVIAIAAFIGLLINGAAGAFVGLVLGFVFTMVVGLLVRKIGGGFVPPKVRRELIQHVLDFHEEAISDLARSAGETRPPAELIEDRVESIVSRAIKLAPTNAAVWSQQNILLAARQLRDEASTDLDRLLYWVLLQRIGKDWYGLPGPY